MLPLFHPPWLLPPVTQSTLEEKQLLHLPILNHPHVVLLRLKHLHLAAPYQEPTHLQPL